MVHFNCHIQEMAPLRPAGIELLIDKLLVDCDTKEDALAAAFCLLRCAAARFRALWHTPESTALLVECRKGQR